MCQYTSTQLVDSREVTVVGWRWGSFWGERGGGPRTGVKFSGVLLSPLFVEGHFHGLVVTSNIDYFLFLECGKQRCHFLLLGRYTTLWTECLERRPTVSGDVLLNWCSKDVSTTTLLRRSTQQTTPSKSLSSGLRRWRVHTLKPTQENRKI